jgi:hypothetical protein
VAPAVCQGLWPLFLSNLYGVIKSGAKMRGMREFLFPTQTEPAGLMVA